MVELSEASRAVIRALLEAPLAWQTPAELARSLGGDLEETTDCVATLDAEGWLVAWDGCDGPGPAVTLSAEAASRLDARLVERGPDEMPRWATRDQDDPPARRALGVFRGERAASLEMVVDPRMPPDAAMEAAEDAAGRLADPDPAHARTAARVARMPRPTLLLGTGLSPWPGPDAARASGGSCPVCGDRPLKPTMYCLSCDRWGLDHRIEDEAIVERPPIPDLREPADAKARREAEARARKAKRLRRQAASEAGRKGKKGARARARWGLAGPSAP